MAKIYGEIPANALMTFDKSFARANGQPLDSTEIYYSKSSAEAYAATDSAYVGQKVVVIENGVLTHYGIEPDSSLKELGSATLGDDQSIVLDGGVLSLKNFGVKYYAYSEEEQTDGTHYVETEGFIVGLEPRVIRNPSTNEFEIAWYEPNPTTIEGVDAKITTLTQTVNSMDDRVAANAEAVSEAKSGVETNAQAISDLDSAVDSRIATAKTEILAEVETVPQWGDDLA